MYILYVDYGYGEKENIYVSKYKETLESIITNVDFHFDMWCEDFEYRKCVPEDITYIIDNFGVHSDRLVIKEIKEV